MRLHLGMSRLPLPMGVREVARRPLGTQKPRGERKPRQPLTLRAHKPRGYRTHSLSRCPIKQRRRKSSWNKSPTHAASTGAFGRRLACYESYYLERIMPCPKRREGKRSESYGGRVVSTSHLLTFADRRSSTSNRARSCRGADPTVREFGWLLQARVPCACAREGAALLERKIFSWAF